MTDEPTWDDKAHKCSRSDCPGPEFEMGYGLAGGGIGVYEFCDVCERIVSKTQDHGE